MSGKSRGRYRSVGSHRDGRARATAGIEGRRIRDEMARGESGEDHETLLVRRGQRAVDSTNGLSTVCC